MFKEKKGKHFIKKPIYEGGTKAMKLFVKENLKYPQVAFDKKVEGSVNLRYAINYKGVVTDVKIISGIGHGCDKEAVRIVKMFSFRIPKNRKLKVLFHKKISIHFRLPKQQPPAKLPVSQVQYSITTTPKKETPTPKKEQKPQTDSGYSYTITIG